MHSPLGDKELKNENKTLADYNVPAECSLILKKVLVTANQTIIENFKTTLINGKYYYESKDNNDVNEAIDYDTGANDYDDTDARPTTTTTVPLLELTYYCTRYIRLTILGRTR